MKPPRLVWALCLGGFLLAGCGLTATRDVEDIDRAILPDRLVQARPTTAGPTPDATSVGGAVYFVDEDRLVALPYSTANASGSAAVQVLLDALAAGPGETDRDRGLSTALPPTTQLRLTALEANVAVVDLTVAQLPPNQTLAIAQLVLTATSLEAIAGLRLTVNGEPVAAPLASGAQTDRPLTRADYEQMLSAP
ncbi:MAG: GerMN domain-containing protein [Sporichthyaceae bacterium]